MENVVLLDLCFVLTSASGCVVAVAIMCDCLNVGLSAEEIS